ncbi:MAG TPA: phenylacetic acid degradation protein PaaY [Burkholderiales bacterium]|nr:phenylacetic acid degradation protein PaaY [Burkholderiales bacterium]
MPKVYSIDGITPVVHPSAYVHPSAMLIGDVIVGARAYIGPCASLRGDFGRIVVEEGANIQDSCILHGFAGKDTVVGADCTIGHGAVLHGCVLRRGALVGMNAVVNDNAEVGEHAIIAALAFVRAEERIPARSLAAGIPAKVRRTVTDQELAWKHENLLVYQDLALRSMKTMKEVEALAEVEPGRRRFEFPTSVPLSELKKQHG